MIDYIGLNKALENKYPLIAETNDSNITVYKDKTSNEYGLFHNDVLVINHKPVKDVCEYLKNLIDKANIETVEEHYEPNSEELLRYYVHVCNIL